MTKPLGLPACLFLDFDGVILESVDVKTRAMARLFADRPEHKEAIVDYHVRNAGVSRFDKFGHYYANLFREPLPDAEMKRLDREFSSLVRAELLRCGFVPGAREFLEAWGSRIPLHVVSATPQGELRGIVGDLGLQAHFQGVHGSPGGKAEHIARILRQGALDPGRCLFVGDAEADRAAAERTGVPFALRMNPQAPVVLPDAATVVGVLPDLRTLCALWE